MLYFLQRLPSDTAADWGGWASKNAKVDQQHSGGTQAVEGNRHIDDVADQQNGQEHGEEYEEEYGEDQAEATRALRGRLSASLA